MWHTCLSKLWASVLLRMSCRFTVVRFSVKKDLMAGLRRFGHVGLTVFALLFRIFVDQEFTSLEFRRKSEVVTRRKNSWEYNLHVQAMHGTFWRHRGGLEAELVLYVLLFVTCVVVISLVFIGSSRSHIILVFAGRTGASSAGGTDLTAFLEKRT